MFDDLDKKQTKENAKAVLKSYNSLRQLVRHEHIQEISDEYLFEPLRTHTIGFRAIGKTHEKAIIEIEHIEQSINRLDPVSRFILINKYCKQPKKDIAVYTRLDMYESQFYRELTKALITFAETYRGGELLVFENGKGIDDYLGEGGGT